MDQENVVHTNHGRLCNLQKEENLAMYNNMDESVRH